MTIIQMNGVGGGGRGATVGHGVIVVARAELRPGA